MNYLILVVVSTFLSFSVIAKDISCVDQSVFTMSVDELGNYDHTDELGKLRIELKGNGKYLVFSSKGAHTLWDPGPAYMVLKRNGANTFISNDLKTSIEFFCSTNEFFLSFADSIEGGFFFGKL